MNILLINNNTQHLDSLKKALDGHQLEIQAYKPGLDFHITGKDLVVLSGGGGEGLEINDVYKKGRLWYDDQMKFVRECNLPVIGICMGFEVIARAYGADVRPLPKMVKGFRAAITTGIGERQFGERRLRQFESHEWGVPSVDDGQFVVLASSSTGIEIIKHKTRPIVATQFHPEKGGTINLPNLIAAV